MAIPTPTSLLGELAQVTELWSPRVVAALNGQFLKVAKVQGEFVWHQHDGEDELFLILRGTLRIQFEDGEVTLHEGECLVVPRGVRHRPVAESECWLALFEPAATTHTGEVVSERTRSIAEQTAHLHRPG
ncbi:MAG TPA: cupin domain-containing protein [Gemmatimonadales bacterium]